MRRRDMSKALFATAVGSGIAAQRVEAQSCTAPYPQTAAEIAAINPVTGQPGIIPMSCVYSPGNVLRYGADPTGTSDSTVAIQAAINQHTSVSPRSIGDRGPAVYIPSGTYKVNSTLRFPTGQLGFKLYGDGPDRTVLVSGTVSTVMFQKVQSAGVLEYGDFSNFSIQANASTSATTAFDCCGMRSCRLFNIRGVSNGSSGFYSLFSLSASPYLCYGNEFDSCGIANSSGWTKVWDFNSGGTANSANNANVTSIRNPWIYGNTGLSVGIDALRSAATVIIGGDIEGNVGATAIISGNSTLIMGIWIEDNSASISYQSAADGVSNTGTVINSYLSNTETISFTPGPDGAQVYANVWINVNTPAGVTWTGNNGTNVRHVSPAANVPLTPAVNPIAGATGAWTLVEATQLTQTSLATEISYLLVYAWIPEVAGGYTQFTVAPSSPWIVTKLAVGMTTQSNGVPVPVGISGISANNLFSVSNTAVTAYTICIALSIQHP